MYRHTKDWEWRSRGGLQGTHPWVYYQKQYDRERE